MNKLIGIGFLGALGVFLLRMVRAQNVSDNSTFKLANPRIHDVNLGGISIRTEIAVNNPTKDSLNMTKPVVSLWSNGKVLTQSVAENKTIQIMPLSVSSIDTIELVLPWTALSKVVGSIITQIPALISAFKTKKLSTVLASLNLPLEMSFSTYVNGIFHQSPPEKFQG
ncbi:MAG: hypothetical protein CFE21_18760 [Bacteroidetes bacterium B1(2017)]|nr:MAG: hypothetical protein CFE21_18760 [Bacteroidetes bacterium B1(2017)]